MESGRNVTQLLVRNFLKAVGVWWFPPMVLQVQMNVDPSLITALRDAMQPYIITSTRTSFQGGHPAPIATKFSAPADGQPGSVRNMGPAAVCVHTLLLGPL